MITWGKGKDLLFPRRCPACDGVVRLGDMICEECRGSFRPVIQPWCMRCGKKLNSEAEYCADCKRQAHEFVRGRTMYEYGSVAKAIYRLKYQGRREYAEYFGREIGCCLGNFIRRVDPDVLIPVPLHPSKMRRRGYNQAALLAREVGRQLAIPVREDLILRVKNTKPLKLQNPRERQNNLKKAFIMKQNDVKLKIMSAIIIDDIYTTGSTVDEMARVLKAGGVKKVYVITLACGAGI